MLTYADVCCQAASVFQSVDVQSVDRTSPPLLYAVCSRMLTYAHACRSKALTACSLPSSVCHPPVRLRLRKRSRQIDARLPQPLAPVCSRMLTYAHVCSRMQVSPDRCSSASTVGASVNGRFSSSPPCNGRFSCSPPGLPNPSRRVCSRMLTYAAVC
jgi:hypothetical protein